jgi:hypothetical protein
MFLPFTLKCQDSLSYLNLRVDNLNFFKNNEYRHDRQMGYTLPGFRIIPKLQYKINENIFLEGGLSLLRYFGSEQYPCYSYSDISLWKANNYHKGFHIMPFFRAQFSLKDNFKLVFGNLHSLDNHKLIAPLYNPEHVLCSDLEQGVQMLFNSKHFFADIWINWQSFIFKTDTHQEVFSFGVSSQLKKEFLNDKLKIYIPIQMVLNHKGGELDTLIKYDIETLSNFAIGLGGVYKFDGIIKEVNLEFNWVKYLKNSGQKPPFSSGEGMYSKLRLSFYDFNFDISYWMSKNFISILGSPHYNNFSALNSNMTYDRLKMLHLHLEYLLSQKENFSVGFELNTYHYFKYTRYSPGYPTFYQSPYMEFSLGVYLKLNPTIRLYTFNKAGA